MELIQLLTRLKFQHLPAQWETVCEQAAKQEWDYPAFLTEALRVEWQGRHVNGVEAGHRILFLTLDNLLSKLKRARDENRLEKQLQQWVYPKVLILDEMGYLPLSREDASLLFRLIQRRYEKASLILTSNKSFIDWGEIFGDQVLATAILDRLLHHATTLNIKGESYRLKEKRKAGLLGRAPVMKPEQLSETD